MKKETFIFYKDWANVLNDLPDTIQLEIYQAITAYAFGTTPKELSPLASVAFAFIKQTIDRDIEKYLSVSQARSQAGKKGGRPLKNKNLQEDKKPLPKKANPSAPKDTPQESSRIKEERLAQGKENFSAKEEEKAFFSGDNAVPQDRESTATGGFTPPTIAEIEAYCRERGNGISGALFYEFYSARDWQMGSQPMKNWKAAVHSWEQREAQEAQKHPKNWKAQRSKLDMLPLEKMEISPVRKLVTSLMYADDRPPRISSLTCKAGKIFLFLGGGSVRTAQVIILITLLKKKRPCGRRVASDNDFNLKTPVWLHTSCLVFTELQALLYNNHELQAHASRDKKGFSSNVSKLSVLKL